MEQSREPHIGKSEKSIPLFDAFIAWIVLISVVAIALLASKRFEAIQTLLLGTFLWVALLRGFRFHVLWRTQPINSVLLLILLVGLFFRTGTYLWVMGGQDQGIYMNMASTYEQTGSPFIKDPVREKLDVEGKKIYDQSAHHVAGGDFPLEGPYPQVSIEQLKRLKIENLNTKHALPYAFHLPGIFIKDLSTSEYVFQFYPLHPIWMAIFGKLFGEEKRVYSLVFFSLLTLVSFYLLALEFSGGNRIPGYLIALFLAINPLHSFFSKFPVAENLTLFFSATGFYFVIKFCKEILREKIQPYGLGLSVGLFFCLFLTRISGFIYILFFYIIFLWVLIVQRRQLGQRLKIYVVFLFLSTLGVYALSVLYGLKYSFPYSVYVYKDVLPKMIFDQWPLYVLAATGITAILSYIFIRYPKPNVQSSLNVKLPASSLIFYLLSSLFFLVIALGISKALITGYREGWNYLGIASSFVLLNYLTPAGFFLLLLGVYDLKNNRHILWGSLVIFLLISWYGNTIYRPKIEYQYYYARYLLSELIPFSLLFIAFYVGNAFYRPSFKKYLSAALVVVLCGYSLYYSYWQLRGREADGANQALRRIESHLDQNDLLLVDFRDERIITPLKYYYHLNVFSSQNLQQIAPGVLTTLATRFNDLFILSTMPIFYETRMPIDGVIETISYREGSFEHVHHIPIKFEYTNEKSLYLYRINRNRIFEAWKILKPSYARVSNFYDDMVWTNGKGVITGLNYSLQSGDTQLVLRTKGWHPHLNDFQRYKLRVLVNGRELKFIRQNRNIFYFKLDREKSTIKEIQILSATFNPKKIGLNEDGRNLGIDVDYIKISGAEDE